MSDKKNIIESALIHVEEIESTMLENAKNLFVESLVENVSGAFSDMLSEEAKEKDDDPKDKDKEFDVDDKVEDPEAEYGEEEVMDDKVKEGTEHDIGKEPDAGRDGTDASGELDEEAVPSEVNEAKASGEAVIHVDSSNYKIASPTSWRGARSLGSGTKWIISASGGESTWDKYVKAGVKFTIILDKKTGDKFAIIKKGNKYEAVDSEDNSVDFGKLKTTYKLGSMLKEAKDKKGELDVPEELFDDEVSKEKSDKKSDGVELKADFEDDDEEKDGDDKEAVKEGLDETIEIDFSEDVIAESENVTKDSEEEIYVFEEGNFHTIAQDEHNNNMNSDLQIENEKLRGSIETLKLQLQESNMYATKMVHKNRLLDSGLFNTVEKDQISERIDVCESVEDVNEVYANIVEEVKNNNPLDSFADSIVENRNIASEKKDINEVYESQSVARMRNLAGIDK
jgi:hypothetical protein